MNEERLQTLFVVGLALSALVGAIAGAFAVMVFSHAPFFSNSLSSASDKRLVSLVEEESATIDVVNRVAPAVVSIVVKQERGKVRFESLLFGSSPDVHELIEVSSGSGFFVSADGYVLTNRHVVSEKDATFFVVTNDGKEFPATLVDTDPFLDVAVLHVDGNEFPTADLGESNDVRIGQTVIAIGNTLSEFHNTVTKGVISGINRRVTAGSANAADVIEQAIQTDAAINPGNSGGPLINLHGEIIGINTAVSVEGEAIAFAIPIDQAKRAVDDVRAFGRIVRPWLGVRYVLVQDEEAQDKRRYDFGALIVAGTRPSEPGVVPGSPAQKSGLKEKDIITKIDGTSISQDHSLSELIASKRPGDHVELELLRDGVIQQISVTLEEYAAL
ncbi:trypsin-like peptidase domain-containing protein [Candidatus Uhrbacteria bacterium]|nr:trypsin-like peptidase domain-containing protein [Candidatus Uhrbacteria bacterium]